MAGQRPYSSQPEDELDYIDWPSSISSLGNVATKSAPRPERRKPMVRLVCPVCAGMVTVNALEVAGSTDSRCSKCVDTTITIDTDDEARIIGITGFDNTEGKVAPKSASKAPDWRVVGGAALAVLALIFFLMMLMNSSRQNEGGAVAPSRIRNEAELASPVTGAGGVPTNKSEQSSPDMFAPAK